MLFSYFHTLWKIPSCRESPIVIWTPLHPRRSGIPSPYFARNQWRHPAIAAPQIVLRTFRGSGPGSLFFVRAYKMACVMVSAMYEKASARPDSHKRGRGRQRAQTQKLAREYAEARNSRSGINQQPRMSPASHTAHAANKPMQESTTSRASKPHASRPNVAITHRPLSDNRNNDHRSAPAKG